MRLTATLVSMINVVNLLDKAHVALLNTLDGMRTSDWEHPNMCGSWSGRDVLAHLASFELLLAELLLTTPYSGQQTAMIDQFGHDRSGFNSAEIARRRNWSLTAIYGEYERAHLQVKTLANSHALNSEIPHHCLRRYGNSMAETVITLGYGHKLAYAAQIATFRNRQLRSPRINWSTTVFDVL